MPAADGDNGRMALRELTITHRDRAGQDAFIEFVPQVFPEIGFRAWRDLGGWDDRYVAFSLVDEGHIVASASRQQMHVVLHGQPRRAWQLSAVGTLPDYRRRGLQEQIMQRLLADVPAGELVFLFGNDSVLHFYPRFGFRRVQEHVFQAECALRPAAPALRTLDVRVHEDRALLLRVAAGAQPVTGDFGVHDHGRILLWYATNFLPSVLRHVPEHDALIAVAQNGTLLRVYDVLSARPFDLKAVLARALEKPIDRIELGFTPRSIWPTARPAFEYTESPLFVRGDFTAPPHPFKFPMLGQT